MCAPRRAALLVERAKLKLLTLMGLHDVSRDMEAGCVGPTGTVTPPLPGAATRWVTRRTPRPGPTAQRLALRLAAPVPMSFWISAVRPAYAVGQRFC